MPVPRRVDGMVQVFHFQIVLEAQPDRGEEYTEDEMTREMEDALRSHFRVQPVEVNDVHLLEASYE